ncbi:hypothetical protein [Actinomadura rupiterrae]|uniref:hypothetical protein n=1 Tax=Actinomadura rupiterrae TaxID=559627 RepID=UPI0020A526EA|nr:hypothetical protein [Actinomadura rupiterrae]MCP2337740.1 hypothetical protein [Actinomadura rupiterrae]
MNATETNLERLIEHAQAELHWRRRRDNEKANIADHGKDFTKMMRNADKLDHYAELIRVEHDNEFKDGWRQPR